MGKLKNTILFHLTTFLGSHIIRLLGISARIKRIGYEHYQRLISEKRTIIFCIWHGRILIPIFLHRNQQIVGMVSQHRDGEIIARIIEKLGYLTVRGSSTRGGRKAAVDMIRALKSGHHGAIMPDGPTGPRHYFKPGAVAIAQKSNAVILPFTFASKHPICFKSWDRFTIWWPFSQCIALYGEPIELPAEITGEEFEAIRNSIQEKMIDLEKQADAYFI